MVIATEIPNSGVDAVAGAFWKEVELRIAVHVWDAATRKPVACYRFGFSFVAVLGSPGHLNLGNRMYFPRSGAPVERRSGSDVF